MEEAVGVGHLLMEEVVAAGHLWMDLVEEEEHLYLVRPLQNKKAINT